MDWDKMTEVAIALHLRNATVKQSTQRLKARARASLEEGTVNEAHPGG